MINILEEKKKVLKMTNKEEKEARNSVLNEIRTIEVLERNEITNEKQYKWFKKAYDTRADSSVIYKNNNRIDLYNKEQLEMKFAKEYMDILEQSMPKQMSEEDVKNIIVSLRTKPGFDFNIGMVMRYFSKEYPYQNKAIISKVFKNI